MMITIKKILVPTDFSEASVPAVGYAISLAKDHQAEVAVVHVLPTDALKEQFAPGYVTEGLTSAAGASIGAARQRSVDDLFERKKQLVRTFLEQRVGAGLIAMVKTKPLVRYGKVVEEIVATAREEQSDLIVMASQASRLTNLFRGRLTERVARRAPCPVLFIQPSAVVTTDKDERVPVSLTGKWAA